MAGKSSTVGLVYQLKITLLDISPPIWRRIMVPVEISMPNLHKVLQTTVGWTNSHLHDFQKGEKNFGEPNPYDEMGLVDYRRMKLKSFFSDIGSAFIYNYDYGDGWTHSVLLEGILIADPEVVYPVCMDGERRAPVEDCGGPPGHEQNLKIIQDRRHPEFKTTMQWLPAGYDPEEFNIVEVNARLRSRGFGLPG